MKQYTMEQLNEELKNTKGYLITQQEINTEKYPHIKELQEQEIFKLVFPLERMLDMHSIPTLYIDTTTVPFISLSENLLGKKIQLIKLTPDKDETNVTETEEQPQENNMRTLVMLDSYTGGRNIAGVEYTKDISEFMRSKLEKMNLQQFRNKYVLCLSKSNEELIHQLDWLGINVLQVTDIQKL